MAWVNMILDILKGLLTPVIAGVVAYIAYQQHKTNRDRFRLELYNKRFKVFHGLDDFLGSVVASGDVKDEELDQFYATTGDSEFLYDDDISDYLEEFHKKAIEFQRLEKMINSLTAGKEREAAEEDRRIVYAWFDAQYEVSRKKFGKYLRFTASENASERQTMNWKRGFTRIAWVLSVGVFIFWVGLDIFYLIDEGWDPAFFMLLASGVLSFIGVWVVYYVGLYIVKGFFGGQPVDEQNQ